MKTIQDMRDYGLPDDEIEDEIRDIFETTDARVAELTTEGGILRSRLESLERTPTSDPCPNFDYTGGKPDPARCSLVADLRSRLEQTELRLAISHEMRVVLGRELSAQVERTRERLDQYEAYSITAASALKDREDLAEARAEAATCKERLQVARAALEEIAGRTCTRNHYSGGRPILCPEIKPDRRHDWCPSCIAARALEGGEK